MKALTKEELNKKVYWVIDGDDDVRSGSYAEALSDKADCLDPTEVPEVVDRVIHERIELICGSWRTIATYASFADAEDAAEDGERILTRRLWEVKVGKDLICPCESEADAEMERLDYIRRVDIDRDIMLFDCWEYARLYHAARTGAVECDDDLLEAIEELLVNTQATML